MFRRFGNSLLWLVVMLPLCSGCAAMVLGAGVHYGLEALKAAQWPSPPPARAPQAASARIVVVEGGTGRVLSREDRRYPKECALFDGFHVRLRDTDDEGDADLDVFDDGHRVAKIRSMRPGQWRTIRGRNGRQFQLGLTSVRHETETVRLAVRSPRTTRKRTVSPRNSSQRTLARSSGEGRRRRRAASVKATPRPTASPMPSSTFVSPEERAGAKLLAAVEVELSKRFPVTPEGYREFVAAKVPAGQKQRHEILLGIYASRLTLLEEQEQEAWDQLVVAHFKRAKASGPVDRRQVCLGCWPITAEIVWDSIKGGGS